MESKIEIQDIIFIPEEQLLIEYIEEVENLLTDIRNKGVEILNILNDKHDGEYYHGPIMFLYRDFLSYIDTLIVMYSNTCIDTSIVLSRTLYEHFLSLMYILKEDSKHRALAYQVSHIHKKISRYKKMINEINSNKNNNLFDRDRLKEIDWFTAKKNLEKSLQKPPYKTIEIEWKRLKNSSGKRKFDPKWYSLYSNIKNLRELSKYVEFDYMYEYMYDIWSVSAHGYGAFNSLEVSLEKEALIRNFRLPDKLPNNLSFIISMSTGVYNSLLLKYGSDNEKENFKKWYKTTNEKSKELVNVNLKKESI